MQIDQLGNAIGVAITSMMASYLGLIILVELVKILVLWLIIKSAVKAGVREALNTPTSEQQRQRAEEDFQKEMEGWN